jgi:hypothetical protein
MNHPRNARADSTRVLVALALLGTLTAGCGGVDPNSGDTQLPPGATSATASFSAIAAHVAKYADTVVLEGPGGSKALISPRLQGRLLTFRVGTVESTGFVNLAGVAAGEVDPSFNNFGGADRFWLYPEAGQFGLYFDPGAELNRKVWKVPASLNQGAFKLAAKSPHRVLLTRDMEVMNYSGTRFSVKVEREVGIVLDDDLPTELGVKLPSGVHFAGATTKNTLTNTGPDTWSPEKGLVGIWILGMFNASDKAAIIAPFRPGSEKDLGPKFNDDYFGKLSVEVPDRFQTLGNAAIFKADARRVGKFGLSQQRTTGLAGSYDYGKNLLTIVKFDVPTIPERYGNSTWVKVQAEPFKGDPFQTYNNGPPDPRTGEIADAPFYELESASPVRPLPAGGTITHRHSTYHFQGDPKKLETLAKQLLDVDLAAVKAALRL